MLCKALRQARQQANWQQQSSVKHETGKTASQLTGAVLCEAQDKQDSKPNDNSSPLWSTRQARQHATWQQLSCVKHKTGKTASQMTTAVLCEAQDRQDSSPLDSSCPVWSTRQARQKAKWQEAKKLEQQQQRQQRQQRAGTSSAATAAAAGAAAAAAIPLMQQQQP